MSNLIEDTCYWCEIRISRSSPNLFWICDYESAQCEFHPIAYNSETLTRTGDTGPHQTAHEVQDIIRRDWVTTVLQRNKPVALRSVDSNVISMSKNPQRTSRSAAKAILPNSGTIRRLVYDQIKSQNDYGMTDHELEMVLRGKHQTISASRRSLVLDGHVVDSGKTRKNPQGNDCIVWVEKDEVFSEVLFHV
jgi:hypothetical protein